MTTLTLADIQEQIADLKVAIVALVASRGDDSARLLKPAEVASLFGYTKSKVYSLIDRGIIPSIRLDEDGTLRVPLIALQALIAQHLKNTSIDTEWLSTLLSKGGSKSDSETASRLS